MRCIAAQEHPTIAKTIGQHAPRGPIFLAQNLEAE
jgi:hypothetical protein